MPSNNWGNSNSNNAPPPAQQQGGGWGGNRQAQPQRQSAAQAASSDPFANMGRALEVDRVGYAPEPEEGGGNFERRDPEPLPSGHHDLFVYVDGIVRWHFGTVVELKVWAPGKPYCFTKVDWNQTPSANTAADPNSPGMRWFRKRLVDAYSAGGWTEDTWSKSAQDPKAIVPPYYKFFVQQVRDGSWLPVLLSASIEVGKYTNVLSIAQVAGPVQSPMPRRVPEFIAEAYRWPYQQDEFTASGNVIRVAKLNKDTFAPGHLGLRNYKDLRP